jgi:hypothetical protein
MKVNYGGVTYNVIGNYKTLNKEEGYVLQRDYKLRNILVKLCKPAITVADMQPGRKYKFPGNPNVYLCIDKKDSHSVGFHKDCKYCILLDTGTIVTCQYEHCEVEEVK